MRNRGRHDPSRAVIGARSHRKNGRKPVARQVSFISNAVLGPNLVNRTVSYWRLIPPSLALLCRIILSVCLYRESSCSMDRESIMIFATWVPALISCRM